MAPVRALPVWKLIAAAGVLGCVGGVALAYHGSQKEEQRLIAVLDEAGNALPTADFKALQSVEPMAADAEALAGIPPFPGAFPRRLAKVTKGQGSAMAIGWFETQQPVDAVISFYEGEFRKLKVAYSSHLYSARSGYACYLENPRAVDTSRLRLVSAVRQGDTTVVFVSNLRPLDLIKTAELPPGVWLPAMAKSPQLFEMSETGSRRFTVLSLVPDSNLGSVEATFRDNLTQRGWAFSDRATAAARVSLEAKRGRDIQTISMTQEPQGVRLLLNFDDRDAKAEGTP